LFLIGRFLKIFSSVTACQNELQSFGSFDQAVSEENIFLRNRPIRNKKCLWQPCLLTDQDKMSNLYTGLFIDASYHVLFHFDKRLQRRRFLEIDQ
jgi:hypothetical protein